MSAAIAAAVIPFLKPVLDKLLSRIPDAGERLEAEREARQMMADAEARIIEAARDVVQAEVTGQSRIQRAWRPIAMLTFLGIIVWIAVVAPIFGLAEDSVDALARVPQLLWTLIMIGMGGYIGGRSLEKITATIMGRPLP